MKYARAEWEKERNVWRSVVQLNFIEAEMNGDAPADSEEDQVVLNKV